MSRRLGSEISAGSTVKVLVSHWALCGSDLRGLQSGRVFPEIMGHEVSGSLLFNERSDQVVSIFPIVPCFVCGICTAGDWRNCPNRRTLGFEVPGARSGILTVDSRLVFKHSLNVTPGRACLTEHIACAIHVASQAEVRALSRNSSTLIVGDGAMAFAFASVMRWINGVGVRLLVKHPERLLFAESLGFDSDLCESEITVSEDVDLLIFACDARGTRFRCVAVEKPLLVAHVARQTSTSILDYYRITKLIDSFAYSPVDFSRAVDLIDCPNFDLSYASEFDEPSISSDPIVASAHLRSLPRKVIKYIFRRNLG